MSIDQGRVPGIRSRRECVPKLIPELRHAASVVAGCRDDHDPGGPARAFTLALDRRDEPIDVGPDDRDDVRRVNDDSLIGSSQDRLIVTPRARAHHPRARPRDIDDQPVPASGSAYSTGASPSRKPTTSATACQVASGTPPPRPSSILLMTGWDTAAAAPTERCDRLSWRRAERRRRPSSTTVSASIVIGDDGDHLFAGALSISASGVIPTGMTP